MPKRSTEDYENWTLDDVKLIKALVEEAQTDLTCAASRARNKTVRERCSRAELVLRAALMMLEVDPADNEAAGVPRDYIASKIQNGIAAYGLDVVRVPKMAPLVRS